MQRILVIGCCGAGKSTFAKELSSKLNLPLVQLDRLFWKPGWSEQEEQIFADILQTELEPDKWIIDGNYLKSLPLRIKKYYSRLATAVSSMKAPDTRTSRALQTPSHAANGPSMRKALM